VNKYGNKKTARNGIVFDSAKEAARYGELLLMLRAGAIKELRLQPEFTLQEAFATPEGEKIRAMRYRADFSYLRRVKEGPDIRWESVIEDVKGYRTKEYEQKKKLMAGMGLHIEEV
jgi:hypothetical protein